jgi:hypothetical protein
MALGPRIARFLVSAVALLRIRATNQSPVAAADASPAQLPGLRNTTGQLAVLEDITRIADRFETIHSIDGGPQAVPPPADRSLIGR